MDLSMPGGGGITATRKLCAAQVPTQVLVLTTSEDDGAVLAALRAGARGYLLKSADEETVRAAVVAVANKELVFGAGIADGVAEFFRAAQVAQSLAFPQLSHREREILDLVARGFDNPTIARSLSLSEKTVRNNVSYIFAKLRVADRARAIVIAREGGLGIN